MQHSILPPGGSEISYKAVTVVCVRQMMVTRVRCWQWRWRETGELERYFIESARPNLIRCWERDRCGEKGWRKREMRLFAWGSYVWVKKQKRWNRIMVKSSGLVMFSVSCLWYVWAEMLSRLWATWFWPQKENQEQRCGFGVISVWVMARIIQGSVFN